jgi:hypothetical protein
MLVGAILAGIFIGIPALVVGTCLAVAKIKIKVEKQKKAQEEFDKYQEIYDNLLHSDYHDTETGIQGSVKELPQLTFARWLKFYNTSPENWDIDICATNIGHDKRNNHYVPTYYKRTYHKGIDGRVRNLITSTAIPIFWTDAMEMYKFDQWVKEEYNEGKAAGFEHKRDESLGQLADFLQEDIEAHRKKIQEDYAKVVDSVKVEGSNIELKIQKSNPRILMTSDGTLATDDLSINKK